MVTQDQRIDPEEDPEKCLWAIYENVTHFTYWLIQDAKEIQLAKSSHDSFVEFPSRFLKASLGTFFFLFDRNRDFSRKSKIVLVGIKLAHLVYQKRGVIFNPETTLRRVLFVRRDVLWVYLMSILEFFKEEYKKGSFVLNSPKGQSSLDEVFLQSVIGLLPREWIVSSDAVRDTSVIKQAMRISQDFRQGSVLN